MWRAFQDMLNKWPEIIDKEYKGREGSRTSDLRGWKWFYRFLLEEKFDCLSFHSREEVTSTYVQFLFWLQNLPDRSYYEKFPGKPTFDIMNTNTYNDCVTSVNIFLWLLFGFKPIKNANAKIINKAFRNDHPQKEPVEHYWNPIKLFENFVIENQIINNNFYDLSYLKKSSVDNEEELAFLERLQLRVAVLLIFFCFLRPGEISSISMSNWEWKFDQKCLMAYSHCKWHDNNFTPFYAPVLDNPNIDLANLMIKLRDFNI
jgi:hypothetical protein